MKGIKRGDTKEFTYIVVFCVSLFMFVVFIVLYMCFGSIYKSKIFDGGASKDKIGNPNPFVSDCILDEKYGIQYDAYYKVTGAKSLYDSTGIQLYLINCSKEDDTSIVNNKQIKDYIDSYVKDNIPNLEYCIIIANCSGPEIREGKHSNFLGIYDYYIYGDEVANYLTDADFNMISFINSNGYDLFPEWETRSYNIWNTIGEYIINGKVSIQPSNSILLLKSIHKFSMWLTVVISGLLLITMNVDLYDIRERIYERQLHRAKIDKQYLEADIKPIGTDVDDLINKYSGGDS